MNNVRTIVIDGKEMTSRASAHAHLAERLSFPDYYGGNLDALYDCLGDIYEKTHIIICHSAELETALGSYGTTLLHILRHSAEESCFLTVSFHDDAEPLEREPGVEESPIAEADPADGEDPPDVMGD